MKILILFTFLYACIENLNAQEIYIPGKIVKGEKAAYYCTTWTKIHVTVRNVNNVDTTRTVYYEDGSIVPDNEEVIPAQGISNKDLVQIFQEFLTAQELEMIKGKIGYGLTIDIVADESGNTKEITFTFRNDDPVVSKFPPDRLYQLEQKFKEAIKLNWYKGAKRMRNVKYSRGIDYRELE